MFRLIDKLAGNSKDKIFPKDGTDEEVAQKFADTFSNKITDIRKTIENRNVHTATGGNLSDINDSTSLEDNKDNELTTFKCITKEELKSVLNSMNSKFCTLDPIPTWLVKECFE